MVSNGRAANLMALGSSAQNTRRKYLIKSLRMLYLKFYHRIDKVAFCD